MPKVIDKAAETTEQVTSQAPGTVKKKWLKTAVCWSMGAFVALNSWLWFTSEDNRHAGVKGSANDSTRDLWSGAGSIDLAVNDWKSLQQRPTVVLLGSSLMMHPFWSMDVEANPKIPDIFHYHGSKTLEKALAQQGVPDQRVFSFAIFGEMVSDAYIYVNDFLTGAKKPDVLVFGIAPRDFSDSDLPAPMATFTFKRLVGLENFPRYASAFLPGWQDKADFVATHSVYLYGKRWRLQHEVEKAVNRIYLQLGFNKEEKAQPQQGSQNAGFMLFGSTEDRWRNSTKEYRRRYHDIENRDLSLQLGFLQKLLSVCEQRHIKVVLVNMPLSARNRALLEPAFYQRFRSTLDSLSARPDVKFIDLGDSSSFTDDDFWDTAHLNHLGGHKLVSRVAPAVADLLRTP